MYIPQSVQVGTLEIGKGIPKICVSVMGRTKEEIMENAKACVKEQPDLIEWRADSFGYINEFESVQEVLEELSRVLDSIPVIFTFRTEKEGGEKPISLKDYVSLNLFVSELETVQVIDIEYYMQPSRMKELITQIRRNKKIVIASHHRFDKTPPHSKMIQLLEEMEASGADIIKLAVMPQRESDVNNLMLTVNEATCGRLKQPIIAMSMGALGIASRIGGELYGSSVTFGCVGAPSAPGQLPIEVLKEELEKIHKMVENISK